MESGSSSTASASSGSSSTASASSNSVEAIFSLEHTELLPPVRNQFVGSCCFAFATLGTLSSAYALSDHKMIIPSIQHLIETVEYTPPCERDLVGCMPNSLITAYKHIMKEGVFLESYYPFKGYMTNRKVLIKPNWPRFRLESFVDVDQLAISKKWSREVYENYIEEVIKSGQPLAAGLVVDNTFSELEGDIIFRRCVMKKKRLHSLMVVGVGYSCNGERLFRVQSSYGKKWGTRGFAWVRSILLSCFCYPVGVSLYERGAWLAQWRNVKPYSIHTVLEASEKKADDDFDDECLLSVRSIYFAYHREIIKLIKAKPKWKMFRRRKMLMKKKSNKQKIRRNQLAFSSSSWQLLGNDIVDEDINIGENEPTASSYPPVQMEDIRNKGLVAESYDGNSDSSSSSDCDSECAEASPPAKDDDGSPGEFNRKPCADDIIDGNQKVRLPTEAKDAEDAQIRAEADAAAEAKRKRELERAAASQALMKMEKTLDINENSRFLEDLEMLNDVPLEQLPSLVDENSPDNSQDGLSSFKFGSSNPSEQLGLYMKADFEEEKPDPTNANVAVDKLYISALLKNRFADTILEVLEKAFSQVEKTDPEKLHCETEKLEMPRREEKARLQAEDEDAQIRAGAETKQKRELEQANAGQALVKVDELKIAAPEDTVHT